MHRMYIKNQKILSIHEKKYQGDRDKNTGRFLPNPNSLFYKMKQLLKENPEIANYDLYNTLIEGKQTLEKRQRIREYKSMILKNMRLKGELATNKDITNYEIQDNIKIQQAKKILKIINS